MIFDPTTRTRRAFAALMAAGLIGGTSAGVAAGARGAPAHPPNAAAAAHVATVSSTVPKPLTRAETAAEDVIGFLEKAQPAKSRAEARVLRTLAHGSAADALRRSGVPPARIASFQRRADLTARLSAGNAPALSVSQAANDVSQLMAGFYARYQDPVPAAVLKLDYLDRQAQLDARAGDTAALRHTVARIATTWRQVRPALVKAGGAAVARSYDRHVTALQRGGTATAIDKEAVHGLDVVDQMEGVFLEK